jgi:hypothetical protein
VVSVAVPFSNTADADALGARRCDREGDDDGDVDSDLDGDLDNDDGAEIARVFFIAEGSAHISLPSPVKARWLPGASGGRDPTDSAPDLGGKPMVTLRGIADAREFPAGAADAPEEDEPKCTEAGGAPPVEGEFREPPERGAAGLAAAGAAAGLEYVTCDGLETRDEDAAELPDEDETWPPPPPPECPPPPC